MSLPEIAKELTLAVIAAVDPGCIAGTSIAQGKAEAIGKDFGQLYRGILIEVVDALKIVGEVRMTAEDWARLEQEAKQELEEWEREQREQ